MSKVKSIIKKYEDTFTIIGVTLSIVLPLSLIIGFINLVGWLSKL